MQTRPSETGHDVVLVDHGVFRRDLRARRNRGGNGIFELELPEGAEVPAGVQVVHRSLSARWQRSSTWTAEVDPARPRVELFLEEGKQRSTSGPAGTRLPFQSSRCAGTGTARRSASGWRSSPASSPSWWMRTGIRSRRRVSASGSQKSIRPTVEDAQRERVVLTRRGEPVALLIGVEGVDWEDLVLQTDRRSWMQIEERRNEETISLREMKTRLSRRTRSDRADRGAGEIP